MTKNQISFDQAVQAIIKHVSERGWDKTNDARGLATSISLEASELLEYYQWKNETFGSKEDLESEVADIFIYTVQFAAKHDMDIPEIIMKKLAKSAAKYPVEIFQIEDEAERNKAWLEAKQGYKKETTL